MKRGVITYNGGKLHYQVAGSGETIVFIHGFSLDHRMWRSQVDFFAQTYQVITYDVRGFGSSSPPTREYTHADDLRAILSHLDVSRAHIVGFSMGGRIATNLTLIYPEIVRSLTLIDAAVDGYEPVINWDIYAEGSTIEAAKEKWLHHAIFAQTRKSVAVTPLLTEMVKAYSGWHWLHADVAQPMEPSARRRLYEITVPTQIIVGEKDITYVQDIAAVLERDIKASTKHVVAGSGHMVPMEEPEATNTLLIDFITGF
jgi:3-oxoadipate enol-lactonase